MNKHLSLLPFVLLCSCTVGPDYKRPDNIPDKDIIQSLRLSPGSRKMVGKDWYTQFNDETLNSLVAETLANSPDAKIAVQKMKQARLNLEISNVAYFPTLDADASYHRLKPSKNEKYAVKEDYYQTGLDASWELDIWGAGRRLSESTRAAAEAASANMDNVQISLTAEVANVYVNLRMAQEQLNLLQKNLELQEKIFRLVSSQSAAGLASQMELSQSHYAVETLKSQIPDLVSAVESYQNALSVLAGKLPGQMNSLIQNSSENIVKKEFDYDLAALYELPIDTVRLRPDVRIAEQNLIAQNARVGQAVANLYPSVSLSAFLGFQSETLSKLLTHKSNMYSYSPAVGLPLFHWNALTNQVKLEKEITEEYALVYQNTVLNAVKEIRDAMVNMTQQYAKNQATEAALLNMRDVSVLTFTQYEKGLIPLSTLLTTLQDLLAVQNSYISGNGALYQSIIVFYKSASAS